MKTSEAGISLIKKFEGFRPHTYACSAGRLTIGYGTTGPEAEKYVNKEITKAEADKLLRLHVKELESQLTDLIKVETSQREWDVIVSFVYNIGIPQFKTSAFLRQLNENRKLACSYELGRWVHVNGKPNEGLKRRRREERRLFLGVAH